MLRIIKLKLALRERAALERATAQAAKNTADIDYIAMMTDVELPEEDTEDAQQEV